MKTTKIRRISPILSVICLLLMVAPIAAQAQQPDAALTKRLDTIEQTVSEVRQLPLKQPIQLEFKTREELQGEVDRDLAAQYTKEDQARDERVLLAFGLIAPGTNLLQVQQKVQGEQIAGYYDPKTNQMVVVRSPSDPSSFSAMDEFVFAHEVTHALQDQNFDLDALISNEDKDLDDQSLAILALIEGDATVCQVDYLKANKALIPPLMVQLNSPDLSSEELDKAPAFLRETLLFPYDQGMTFVDALKDGGGWDAVDQAYSRPPASTEQILHPDKYVANERPIDVTVPDYSAALGAGWSPVETNDMGELGVRILLSGQSESKADANRAAAGWGGDEYRVWGKGDQTVLVWRTAWDTGTDADQFTSAMSAYEAQRWGVKANNSAAGQHWFESSGQVTVIVRNGQDVTYVLAPDRATAQRIVRSL